MKKIISKILFLGLVLLGYKGNTFAGAEMPTDSGRLAGDIALPIYRTSMWMGLLNWFIFLFFLPTALLILFFYGSYFYLRKKKGKIKREKAKKRLRLANWLLIIDIIFIGLFFIIFYLLKLLEA